MSSRALVSLPRMGQRYSQGFGCEHLPVSSTHGAPPPPFLCSHEADRGSNARAFINLTMQVVLIYDSGDATVKHMMLWKDDNVVDYKTQNTHR